MVWIPRIEELPMSVMFSNKIGLCSNHSSKNGIGSTSL